MLRGISVRVGSSSLVLGCVLCAPSVGEGNKSESRALDEMDEPTPGELEKSFKHMVPYRL